MFRNEKWLREMRKGFLALVILRILAEEPAHGYGIIQKIRELTDNTWEPSPGSVYPILSKFEKMNYIESKSIGNKKKIYTLTEKGEEVLKFTNIQLEKMCKEIKTLFGDIF
jgi:DNA-binding PadR family transcriptional regulator